MSFLDIMWLHKPGVIGIISLSKISWAHLYLIIKVLRFLWSVRRSFFVRLVWFVRRGFVSGSIFDFIFLFERDPDRLRGSPVARMDSRLVQLALCVEAQRSGPVIQCSLVCVVRRWAKVHH